MSFGAHIAGEKIHGPVLPEKKDEKQVIAPVGKQAKDLLAYAEVEVSILEAKCYSCHAGTKKKGGLFNG